VTGIDGAVRPERRYVHETAARHPLGIELAASGLHDHGAFAFKTEIDFTRARLGVIVPLGHETFVADHARLDLADAKQQMAGLLGHVFLERLVMQWVVAVADQLLQRRRVLVVPAHDRCAADVVLVRAAHDVLGEVDGDREWLHHFASLAIREISSKTGPRTGIST
jgi:hypothetical protein